MSYDADSKVITKTDARGIVITYGYDSLDRVTGKTYSNGDAAVGYLYDQSSYNGLTITNGIGRQTGMSDASGATAWSFDVMGRALTERRTINGVTKSVGYSYNLDGSVATVVYPSGRTITYSYNTAGQALSAVDAANGINYATAASYAPPGELLGLTNGSGGAFAGIVTSNSFNSRLQPITLSAATTGSGGQTVISLSYTWNLGTADNGTIAKIVNNRDNNRSQNFTYDALNRVATAYTDGTNWGDTYTVDAWGNLSNKTPKTGKVTGENLQQAANVHNQFVGFSYDASGNTLSDGTSTYAYDAENRVKKAAGMGYIYDGNGERVRKCVLDPNTGACTTPGTLYWGGSSKDALDESDGSGNLTDEFVFFNGKRIARRVVATGAVYYYFSDHLGSSNVITDASGVRQAESDFYPYGGEVVILADSTANHYKFTGKERDTETGADYFFARYYSSALGRFLTPDWSATPTPVPYANLGDPQSLNLYSYVGNNPITGIDPDGHLTIGQFDTAHASGEDVMISGELVAGPGQDPLGLASSPYFISQLLAALQTPHPPQQQHTIRVMEVEGAGVNIFNHVVVSVDDEPPVGFGADPPPSPSQLVKEAKMEDTKGTPGKMEPKRPQAKVIKSVTLKVSAAQAKAAQAAIKNRTANPGNYHLTLRNCAEFAEDVLSAAGIRAHQDDILPDTLLNDLIKDQQSSPH